MVELGVAPLGPGPGFVGRMNMISMYSFILSSCSLLPAAEADDGRGQHEAESEAAGGGGGGAQHQHLLHPAVRHHRDGGRKYKVEFLNYSHVANAFR